MEATVQIVKSEHGLAILINDHLIAGSLGRDREVLHSWQVGIYRFINAIPSIDSRR